MTTRTPALHLLQLISIITCATLGMVIAPLELSFSPFSAHAAELTRPRDNSLRPRVSDNPNRGRYEEDNNPATPPNPNPDVLNGIGNCCVLEESLGPDGKFYGCLSGVATENDHDGYLAQVPPPDGSDQSRIDYCKDVEEGIAYNRNNRSTCDALCFVRANLFSCNTEGQCTQTPPARGTKVWTDQASCEAACRPTVDAEALASCICSEQQYTCTVTVHQNPVQSAATPRAFAVNDIEIHAPTGWTLVSQGANVEQPGQPDLPVGVSSNEENGAVTHHINSADIPVGGVLLATYRATPQAAADPGDFWVRAHVANDPNSTNNFSSDRLATNLCSLFNVAERCERDANDVLFLQHTYTLLLPVVTASTRMSVTFNSQNTNGVESNCVDFSRAQFINGCAPLAGAVPSPTSANCVITVQPLNPGEQRPVAQFTVPVSRDPNCPDPVFAQVNMVTTGTNRTSTQTAVVEPERITCGACSTCYTRWTRDSCEGENTPGAMPFCEWQDAGFGTDAGICMSNQNNPKCDLWGGCCIRNTNPAATAANRFRYIVVSRETLTEGAAPTYNVYPEPRPDLTMEKITYFGRCFRDLPEGLSVDPALGSQSVHTLYTPVTATRSPNGSLVFDGHATGLAEEAASCEYVPMGPPFPPGTPPCGSPGGPLPPCTPNPVTAQDWWCTNKFVHSRGEQLLTSVNELDTTRPDCEIFREGVNSTVAPGPMELVTGTAYASNYYDKADNFTDIGGGNLVLTNELTSCPNQCAAAKYIGDCYITNGPVHGCVPGTTFDVCAENAQMFFVNGNSSNNPGLSDCQLDCLNANGQPNGNCEPAPAAGV